MTQNQRFNAEAVVVTVPLGVLKNGDIQFTPALPPRHQAAIKNLGMGTLNKLILEFPEGTWIPNAEFITTNRSYSDLGKAPCNFYINYQYYGNRPILVGLIGGEFAPYFETLSNEAVTKLAMDDLRGGFGEKVPMPTSIHLTRWGQDPFSRGSYSGLPIGSSSHDRMALNVPINDQLYFAGEATDVHDYGTIHGAYFSGLRTARAILE